jgi:hypothetical protein
MVGKKGRHLQAGKKYEGLQGYTS